jgi:hypothetical protein
LGYSHYQNRTHTPRLAILHANIAEAPWKQYVGRIRASYGMRWSIGMRYPCNLDSLWQIYIYMYQPIQFCQPSELKQLAFHRSPQYKCCWMNPWFLLGKSTFHRWFSLRFQGALGPSLTAHVSGHLLHQCSTQQAGWSHAFPAHAGEAPKRGASWKSAAALIFRIGWWENWNRNSHLMVKTMVSG